MSTPAMNLRTEEILPLAALPKPTGSEIDNSDEQFQKALGSISDSCDPASNVTLESALQ
jgi:hypothetical protein